MFGITVIGIPNADPLFLSGRLGAGHFSAAQRRGAGVGAIMGETFTIPIGPQHPALKEPGHFEFSVDGEIITGATVRLGYAHRGIEKATEAAQLDARPLPARTHLRDLLARSRAGVLHRRRKAGGRDRAAARSGDPHAGRGDGARFTAICSGWASPRTKPVSTRCSCTRGATAKPSWMRSKRLTGNRVNYSANLLGGVKCDVTPEIAEPDPPRRRSA